MSPTGGRVPCAKASRPVVTLAHSHTRVKPTAAGEIDATADANLKGMYRPRPAMKLPATNVGYDQLMEAVGVDEDAHNGRRWRELLEGE